MNTAVLRVTYAGPLVSYQDAGRTGHLRYGVPASGPMDRLSHAAANVALGNPENNTAIEISLGGLALECVSGSLTLALAGGNFLIDHGGQKTSGWNIFALTQGEKITIRAGDNGSWAYLAFAGSLDVPKWLGHSATHSTSGFGGGQLRSGDEIHILETRISEDRHGTIERPTFISTGQQVHVVKGPQDRFFNEDAIDTFLNNPYTLTDSFDRMGVRLSGPKLELASALSIPSEPIIRGSVQVAGDGAPTVLLADHQTTGGYPKIATLISDDVDKLSQMRAKDTVRFVAISAEEAVRKTRETADERTQYIESIAEPKGTLNQRLMRENLISGVV